MTDDLIEQGPKCACMRVTYRTEESRPGLIVRAWWACDQCERVFNPVLPPLPDGLDFGKALRDAGIYETWFSATDIGARSRFVDNLNTQVAALIRQAEAKVREEMAETVASAYHEGREQERAKYAPLVALVAEWQEARKAMQDDTEDSYEASRAIHNRLRAVEAALLAFTVEVME